jgi:hypothetical protein
MRQWNFIRPLYWQKPMPAVPAALKEIDFGFLDLNNLKIDVDAAIHGTTQKPFEQAEEVAALFPVIALERDAPPATTEQLQDALKRVVPFLETLAGLRYYPPPTLLVDEYTITQVRSRITVDRQPDESDDVNWALRVAQSLALAFHVGTADFARGLKEDEAKQLHQLKDEEDWGDYRHVRKLCEYIFYEKGPVVAYLSGNDPFQIGDPKYLDQLKRYIREARSSSFVYSLDSELRKILTFAAPVDKKTMMQILGVNPLPDLSDLRKQHPNRFSLLLEGAGVGEVSENRRQVRDRL